MDQALPLMHLRGRLLVASVSLIATYLNAYTEVRLAE